jgi:hypothetical protein
MKAVHYLALAAITLSSCSQPPQYIVREELQQGTDFGMIYQIEVADDPSRRRGELVKVVGSDQELRSLDNRLNVGDRVIIGESIASSINGETIISANRIGKVIKADF